MQSSLVFFALLLSACEAQPGAVAQPGSVPPTQRTSAWVRPRREKLFSMLDNDHDGYITKADIPATQAALLSKKEKSGSLEEGEQKLLARMTHPRGYPLLRNFDRMDQDHDGKLSKLEFILGGRGQANDDGTPKSYHKAGPGANLLQRDPGHAGHDQLQEKLFNIMDNDHDGYITKADIPAAKAVLLSKKDKSESLEAHEQRLLHRMTNPRGFALERNWDKMDQDHDGKLSKDEFMMQRRDGSWVVGRGSPRQRS